MSAQTETRPPNFITAKEARSSRLNPWSSYTVFKGIADSAESGGVQYIMPWAALSDETKGLLGEAEYKIERGGLNNEVAVITW